ncbi:ribonuclease HII [Formosa sp. S-31]|uniref:ribonuclease HII n=1 Tax=Formosa sp. S-31 TaxID=2790949 RepID=UPI003EBCA4C6
MRAFGLTVIFCLLLIGCNTSNTSKYSLIQFVPEHTISLVKTSNFQDLKSSLQNNNLIQEFTGTQVYNNISGLFKTLNQFKPEHETVFCFSKDAKDSLQVTLITKYTKDLFIKDSLNPVKSSQINYKSNTITKSEINNQALYSIIIDSIFIGSTSKTIIENSLSPKLPNPEFEKIYSTTGTDKTFSVILDSEYSKRLNIFMPTDSIPLNKFTKYLALDTDITQDEITLNGITKASDSTEQLINIFKNTIPQENKLATITPTDCDAFMSFTFNDFSNLQANLVAYHNQDSPETTLFDNTSEIGVIYQDAKRAVAFYSLDDMATNEALIDSQEIIEEYRQIEIKTFEHPEWFPAFFKPLIHTTNASYYCNLDSFYVFAEDLDLLKNIIASYQNKSTFAERDSYANLSKSLSNASSLLLVGQAPALKTVLVSNFKDDLKVATNDYKMSAVQYVFDQDFAHVNMVIKKNKGQQIENSVSEELNIKLDANILNNPQFVVNHITRQKEIVVQDINNNLYLISNKGKVLWKKQIEGPVLGEISQIDMYKNGRLQLAFTTPSRVYVLDRNGKDVPPFPLKFNDKITQPLAVFDYDNNKKYRLLVVQDKNVLMYDARGNRVKGFKFTKANNTIVHQPQHFREKGKDYLVFKTTDKLYILSRTGQERIKPKTNYKYSNEGVYFYNDKFTTTAENGALVLIDLKGNVASQNINLETQHHIDATSRTLVAQSGNRLAIRNKTLELDFGSYTPAKLFYINNKIYVTTTDLQAQKVYVYDSQGETISNFPVYGSSALDLANLDKDPQIEGVTKGNDNAIIIYQVN